MKRRGKQLTNNGKTQLKVCLRDGIKRLETKIMSDGKAKNIKTAQQPDPKRRRLQLDFKGENQVKFFRCRLLKLLYARALKEEKVNLGFRENRVKLNSNLLLQH